MHRQAPRRNHNLRSRREVACLAACFFPTLARAVVGRRRCLGAGVETNRRRGGTRGRGLLPAGQGDLRGPEQQPPQQGIEQRGRVRAGGRFVRAAASRRPGQPRPQGQQAGPAQPRHTVKFSDFSSREEAGRAASRWLLAPKLLWTRHGPLRKGAARATPTAQRAAPARAAPWRPARRRGRRQSGAFQ